MKIHAVAAVALIGVGIGLPGGQALAANFGVVTLRAGETQIVNIGSTSREVRACNDFFSAGRVVVTIASNLPHDLAPGVCAEDIGDRMMIQSFASGIATVYFRSLFEGAGRNMIDE